MKTFGRTVGVLMAIPTHRDCRQEKKGTRFVHHSASRVPFESLLRLRSVTSFRCGCGYHSHFGSGGRTRVQSASEWLRSPARSPPSLTTRKNTEPDCSHESEAS